MKKKILFCGESSHIKSGFGNFTKEMVGRLHKNPNYSVAEMSCYRNSRIPKTQPWKIYPAAVTSDHALHKSYSALPSNVFGSWIFDYILLDFKPDIVIDVRDPWMFSYQESSPLRKYYHWLICPTYDSSPPKIEFITSFENSDTLCFHTEWAKKDYSKFSKSKDSFVINDSVDTSVFKPIKRNKKSHKQLHGLDPDCFIIGSVVRNQKRKLIPDLFDVLSNVSATHNNVFLYLHTTYPELNGWDIPNLLLEYKVYDKVLFTYFCKFCQKYSVSKYQGHISVCPLCNKKNAMCGVTNGVSDAEMSDIYNLFDIYIQYAICEGFGIPQVEAAACGIPLITIDSGAMGEVGKKLQAKMVPVKNTFKELETGAFRIYPDNSICVDYVKEYLEYSKPEINDISLSIRGNLIKNYSWDISYNNLKHIIDNIEMKELQGKWDAPNVVVDTKIVNENKDIRKKIYSIIDMIGKESLKRTSMIDTIINDATNGYILTPSGIRPYSPENALKVMEAYINHANRLENIRLGKDKMPASMEDILNYE